MRPSILVIGKTGQLAQELRQRLADYQDNLAFVGRSELDLSQPDTIVPLLSKLQPNVIINAAAYTAVDKAESEPELAKMVNAIAPKILAQEAQKLGAFLIHISTDYVFDGQKSTPYQETDLPNPLGVYGETKLMGEEAIQSQTNHYLIVRTSWVYGSQGKGNFVKTMLRLGKEREEIRVVADQVGSPTWTGDLANAIASITSQLNTDTPPSPGIYHYTNSGVTSWYDFAVAIFEEAKALDFPLTIDRVIPITTTEYPTPAKRPAYSVLSCGKISSILGTFAPHWRQGLRQMLKEYIADN